MRRIMSMTLGANVLNIACTSAALSADMPARNYTKAPAMVGPASNWAGLYLIPAATVVVDHRLTENIARLGINYKSGGF